MGDCGGIEEEIGVTGDGDTCVISAGLSIGDDDGRTEDIGDGARMEAATERGGGWDAAEMGVRVGVGDD